MKKTRKGFTLIELLAVIVILGIIMTLIVPQITKTIVNSRLKIVENNAHRLMNTLNLAQKEHTLNNNLETLIITYNNGNEKINVSNLKLNFTGQKPQNGKLAIDTNGDIALAFHDGKYCIEKDFESNNIIITTDTLENCNLEITIYYTDANGANSPRLLDNMIPVIWDESTNTWIEASKIDNPDQQNWFDYEKKQWANAVTKNDDGEIVTFWVWIPRYAYKIGSNFHTSIASTIEIKFLNGTTNSPKDNTKIETNGYDGSENGKNTKNHYFLHPAFKFENEDLPGFWVAKFEPSGNVSNDNNEIKILPGKNSLASQTISTFYNKTLDMKEYICNNNCDTHMMKNTEWGAVAYLAQSKYGKNGKLDQNTSLNTTGGVNYIDNVNQSTTGTIYGIYDMSGGKWERTMGVLLSNNIRVFSGYDGFDETSIASINSKYIDEYTTYEATKNQYGDAIWEISSNDNGLITWYSETVSNFPIFSEITPSPWFHRGDDKSSSNLNLYGFLRSSGNSSNNCSFRPVALYSKDKITNS